MDALFWWFVTPYLIAMSRKPADAVKEQRDE